MRRKDRQKDENFALKVADESLFGSVAIRDESVESGVFIVVLSLARENFTLYAHGAKGGKKSELFKDGALA